MYLRLSNQGSFSVCTSGICVQPITELEKLGMLQGQDSWRTWHHQHYHWHPIRKRWRMQLTSQAWVSLGWYFALNKPVFPAQPVSFGHVPFSEPPSSLFWSAGIHFLTRKSEGGPLFMKALISSRGLYHHDLIFQSPASKSYPLWIRAQHINFLEDTSIQSIRIFFFFSLIFPKHHQSG